MGCGLECGNPRSEALCAPQHSREGAAGTLLDPQKIQVHKTQEPSERRGDEGW